MTTLFSKWEQRKTFRKAVLLAYAKWEFFDRNEEVSWHLLFWAYHPDVVELEMVMRIIR